MIHLLQSEYDELVAARESLALLREEQVANARRVTPAIRVRTAKILAETALEQARAMGLHLTVERVMNGAPSMSGIGYVIEAWPDQRAA